MTEASENKPENNMETITRPKPVLYLALIFFVLAVIDFIFSVKGGLVHKTMKYNEAGVLIGTGINVELLWLFLYAIGSGLMRGGKFARFMASAVGVIALIIPGLFVIYYLYRSDSKEYFNTKKCPDCGDTSYTNNGYKFDAIDCKKCTKPLSFKNA